MSEKPASMSLPLITHTIASSFIRIIFTILPCIRRASHQSVCILRVREGSPLSWVLTPHCREGLLSMSYIWNKMLNSFRFASAYINVQMGMGISPWFKGVHLFCMFFAEHMRVFGFSLSLGIVRKGLLYLLLRNGNHNAPTSSQI